MPNHQKTPIRSLSVVKFNSLKETLDEKIKQEGYKKIELSAFGITQRYRFSKDLIDALADEYPDHDSKEKFKTYLKKFYCLLTTQNNLLDVFEKFRGKVRTDGGKNPPSTTEWFCYLRLNLTCFDKVILIHNNLNKIYSCEETLTNDTNTTTLEITEKTLVHHANKTLSEISANLQDMLNLKITETLHIYKKPPQKKKTSSITSLDNLTSSSDSDSDRSRASLESAIRSMTEELESDEEFNTPSFPQANFDSDSCNTPYYNGHYFPDSFSEPTLQDQSNNNNNSTPSKIPEKKVSLNPIYVFSDSLIDALAKNKQPDFKTYLRKFSCSLTEGREASEKLYDKFRFYIKPTDFLRLNFLWFNKVIIFHECLNPFNKNSAPKKYEMSATQLEEESQLTIQEISDVLEHMFNQNVEEVKNLSKSLKIARVRGTKRTHESTAPPPQKRKKTLNKKSPEPSNELDVDSELCEGFSIISSSAPLSPSQETQTSPPIASSISQIMRKLGLTAAAQNNKIEQLQKELSMEKTKNQETQKQLNDALDRITEQGSILNETKNRLTTVESHVNYINLFLSQTTRREPSHIPSSAYYVTPSSEQPSGSRDNYYSTPPRQLFFIPPNTHFVTPPREQSHMLHNAHYGIPSREQSHLPYNAHYGTPSTELPSFSRDNYYIPREQLTPLSQQSNISGNQSLRPISHMFQNYNHPPTFYRPVQDNQPSRQSTGSTSTKLHTETIDVDNLQFNQKKY